MFESLCSKVAGLEACDFIKRRLQHRCFPVKLAECLRTPILKNIWEHSHKERKDSLETRAEPAVFSL